MCDKERRRWPNCHFKLSIVAPLPVARAEDSFVEQIVRNLLTNAAKYGPPDGQIELIADAQDGCPRVRVLDRGPGVEPCARPVGRLKRRSSCLWVHVPR